MLQKNSKEDVTSQKIYGLLPEDFARHPMNPAFHSDHYDNDDDAHSHDDTSVPFMDKIIISDNNRYYLFFNSCVTILMLFSSYYYGYLSANRFHLIEVHKEDPAYYMREMNTVMAFELIFLLHMFTQFFVEFRIEGQEKPIRDIKRIANRYVGTNLIYDLIPLVPLQLLHLTRSRQYIFYSLKMIRVFNGFSIFDVPTVMEKIKFYYQESLQNLVDNKPELANDIY